MTEEMENTPDAPDASPAVDTAPSEVPAEQNAEALEEGEENTASPDDSDDDQAEGDIEPKTRGQKRKEQIQSEIHALDTGEVRATTTS